MPRSRLFLLAPLTALLTACVVSPYPYSRGAVYGDPGPSYGYGSGVIVDVAPPRPYIEVVPPLPYAGALWIGGFWGWNGGRHQWVPGRWDRARPGYRWQPHTWVQQGGRWQERGGRWDRGGR